MHNENLGGSVGNRVLDTLSTLAARFVAGAARMGEGSPDATVVAFEAFDPAARNNSTGPATAGNARRYGQAMMPTCLIFDGSMPREQK